MNYTADPLGIPDLERVEILALKAMSTGMANQGQQLMALRVILHKFSNMNEVSFRPGLDGAHLTAFAEGKRFVGNAIMGAIEVKLGDENGGRPEQARRNPKPANPAKPTGRQKPRGTEGGERPEGE